jgi:hypothetical protein
MRFRDKSITDVGLAGGMSDSEKRMGQQRRDSAVQITGKLLADIFEGIRMGDFLSS